MSLLLEASPLGGLDVTHGATRLREVDLGRVTWLAPWAGEEVALGHALQAAFSLSFPHPGETQESAVGRILWTGRAQALLIGPEPKPGLESHGAVVDQEDGWAAMELTGEGAAAVMARLTPLDLRAAGFPPGRTARTMLGHMNAQVTALEDGFEILVMRSMAGTAAHELEEAMRSVAARASARQVSTVGKGGPPSNARAAVAPLRGAVAAETDHATP